MTGKKSKGEDGKQQSKIEMTAPWDSGGHLNSGTVFARHAANTATGYEDRELDLNDFVQRRSQVHTEYIKQVEKTKRMAIIVGCLCIVTSAIIMVFAPENKTTISYIIGIALIIVALGAFGYGRFWMKSKVGEISASRD